MQTVLCKSYVVQEKHCPAWWCCWKLAKSEGPQKISLVSALPKGRKVSPWQLVPQPPRCAARSASWASPPQPAKDKQGQGRFWPPLAQTRHCPLGNESGSLGQGFWGLDLHSGPWIWVIGPWIRIFGARTSNLELGYGILDLGQVIWASD